MASLSTHKPLSIALPPVLLAGELQHIFCNAADAEEFLASAHAWLEMFVLAQDATLAEAEVWSRVQAAHDEALLRVGDAGWCDALHARLENSLLKIPMYQSLWELLQPQVGRQRNYH